ncbi:MAG: hypothetical protein CL994_00115 [Euryarchaeota archaeon]|jgi:hypothetical protein|nr:hypothetical protein [Euryarchaeota archaeon]|tara:strand:+ start:131 stop:535 length:405 start_codon:yes stop_codon:yes gene_type:complete
MVFGTLLASLSQVGKEHDTGGVEFWREPMRAGWLMKQGDVIRTWRRRWFVLKDGKLFWFLDSNVTPASKTRGVIDMRYCLSSTSAVDKTGNEASFEITCMGESHVFVCETVAEKDAWLSSVGACIARASRSFAR